MAKDNKAFITHKNDKKKTIELFLLNKVDITVNLLANDEGKWGGTIETGLKESCSYCAQAGCNRDCDESQAGGFSDDEELRKSIEVDEENRQRFNASIDGVESMILALACAGVDITTKKMLKAFETCINACTNL